MTDGNSSLQSATLPTSLWVGNESDRHSAMGPATPGVCGIVVALPEEIATLTRQKLAPGDCVAIAENILLGFAGAGPVNAERAARELISMGATRLISWGCAAALAPHLKPGDLVIPEKLISEQQLVIDTDSQWLQRLQNLLPATLSIVNGCLAESGRIIATSSDKQLIHTKTAAVALDMESAAVVQAAQQQNIPCLVIRAIADPATMDLPQAVIHSLNDQGQVELSKLLRFLLTHPWEIPVLIKLGLHFNAAQKTLKTVARQISEIIQLESAPTNY